MRNDLKRFCSERIKSFSLRIGQLGIIEEWEKFIHGKSQISWSRCWGLVAVEDWLNRNSIKVI